jgi:hypothetical protein
VRATRIGFDTQLVQMATVSQNAAI